MACCWLSKLTVSRLFLNSVDNLDKTTDYLQLKVTDWCLKNWLRSNIFGSVIHLDGLTSSHADREAEALLHNLRVCPGPAAHFKTMTEVVWKCQKLGFFNLTWGINAIHMPFQQSHEGNESRPVWRHGGPTSHAGSNLMSGGGHHCGQSKAATIFCRTQRW